MTDVLRIENVSGGYTQSDIILDEVSLSLESGTSIGIIGMNGCGKSTLGKAIMNMLPFRRGSVFLSGKSISLLDTRNVVKSGISIMFQGGRVFSGLSVMDNIRIALQSQRNSLNDELINNIPLLSLPKNELLMMKADALSGGQKHQLALAMILATAPKVVILDEPGAGLSPKSLGEMYGILHNVMMNTGISIVLIEQNISRAVSFCKKTYLLDSGKIVKEFTPLDLDQVGTYFLSHKSL